MAREYLKLPNDVEVGIADGPTSVTKLSKGPIDRHITRMPGRFFHGIDTPAAVIEIPSPQDAGSARDSKAALHAAAAKATALRCYELRSKQHFNLAERQYTAQGLI